MKLPCALVRDLLPLYHDQVCAPESCDAVEEHLKDCEACQGVYHALGDAPGEGAPACSLEAAALRQVKKRIQLRYVFIAVCVLLLCVGGGAGLGMWMNTATVDIPVENIESAWFEKDTAVRQVASTEVWGALKVRVKTNYPPSVLEMKVLPMDRKGNKWVMLMAQRATVWDFVKGSLGIGPKYQGEDSHVRTIFMDWFAWADQLAEFAGRGQYPPEEAMGCFISEVYYLSDYDVYSGLDGNVPRDDVRAILKEEGVRIWERPESLEPSSLIKGDLFDQE